MRKWLLRILGATAILLTVAWFNRSWIFWTIIAPLTIVPDHDFSADDMTAIDYAVEDNWASLPQRADDLSDQTPDGYVPPEPAVDVDVFYIHPTSSRSADTWNLSMDGERESELLQEVLLPQQPAAFTGCCNVYAPYYRQAAFYSFMAPSGDNGDQAIEAAYMDVRAAFHHFVANWSGDRPFVIAGHSQGSGHGIRLVEEEILGTGLQHRMVAAYLPGFRLPVSSSITPCDTPNQTGCALSWNSMEEGGTPPPDFEKSPLARNGSMSREDLGDLVCNPPMADSEAGYTGYSVATGLAPSIPGGACRDGFWYVPTPELEAFGSFELTPGWYHVYEYAHTWVAIGEDVTRRTNAWAAAR